MLNYKMVTDTLKEISYSVSTNNKKETFINIESGFDIETTSCKINGEKASFMYVWMFGIGYGNPIYYGRTWEEFLDLCNILTKFFNTNEERRLVIYVHNLGYEFQFMRKYFDWHEIFAISERKPLKATTKSGIEFRDSYTLSGYSLANTAKNLAKHKVKKMVGDLDYSLIRHKNTPLTKEETTYCENDIEIILAYINEQIEQYGDITKIPMTNTGRVRSYVKSNCFYKKGKNNKNSKGHYFRYKKIMDDLTIDVETYAQLKTAFMGGFTHANSNYSGQLLNDVSSIDFTSSYPAVMISEKFPMSRFQPYQVKSIKQLNGFCEKYAVVMNVKFEGIRAKITQENYLSESKCRDLKNPTINNGRIFSADSLVVTLTDIDYKIMNACYEWDDISISNLKYAHKDYLPKPIIDSILKLYQDKTELKDVVGSEVEYMLSKGMLNSIYGMCVTDPVKDNSIYGSDHEWGVEKVNIEEEILNYNTSKNRFLYYAWGIWVTAYARMNLWTGILAVGDDYVYSDTDSLKILNYEKHKQYIKWYDETVVNKMLEMCDELKIDKSLLNPKTKDGVEKMIGIWDFEGTYKNFKTLGAKRYLVDHKGKLQLTVAGLSKQNGLNYMLEKSNGDILETFKLFDDSLYIPSEKTGKMTHTYLDNPCNGEIIDHLGNKGTFYAPTGVHLEECDFTLSISKQYTEFLTNLINGYIYKGVNYE